MKRKKEQLKRPYATHYFRSAHDRVAEHVSNGACKTEEGAIRATVPRIFLGQYAKAVIIDRESGTAIYHVKTGAGGIQVRYGSGIEFKSWKEKAA